LGSFGWLVKENKLFGVCLWVELPSYVLKDVDTGKMLYKIAHLNDIQKSWVSV